MTLTMEVPLLIINALEWKKRIEKNAFSIPKRSANDEITYLFKGKKNLTYFPLYLR
jgi:hypothetical protein